MARRGPGREAFENDGALDMPAAASKNDIKSRTLPHAAGSASMLPFGISLFVIVAAAAGLYTLGKVGQTLDRITIAAADQALANAADGDRGRVSVRPGFGPAD